MISWPHLEKYKVNWVEIMGQMRVRGDDGMHSYIFWRYKYIRTKSPCGACNEIFGDEGKVWNYVGMKDNEVGARIVLF